MSVCATGFGNAVALAKKWIKTFVLFAFSHGTVGCNYKLAHVATFIITHDEFQV
jgi:hypothetical protein